MAAAAFATAATALSRTLKVVAIPGSLRAASTNAGLARYVAATHPGTMDVKLADISEFPVFNADLFDKEGNPPAPVAVLRKQIEEADAVVLTVPEYNYAPAPAMSNAIDWVPPSIWKGKAIAMMSSGGFMGCSRAQLQLRQKFVFLEGHVLQRPEIMINQFTGVKFFDDEGNLTSEKWEGRIQEQLAALEGYARTWMAGREAVEAAAALAKAGGEGEGASSAEVKVEG